MAGSSLAFYRPSVAPPPARCGVRQVQDWERNLPPWLHGSGQGYCFLVDHLPAPQPLHLTAKAVVRPALHTLSFTGQWCMGSRKCSGLRKPVAPRGGARGSRGADLFCCRV